MSNIQFCSNCGNKLSADSAFCSKCGSKTELPEVKKENNNQASLTPVIDKTDLPPPDSEIEKTIVYPKARAVKRVFAHFIDMIIAVFIFAGIFFGVSTMINASGVLVLILLATGLISFLYYTFIRDAYDGQGYGKKLMGLMVVDLDTNKPLRSKKKAFKRANLSDNPIGIIKGLLSDSGRTIADFKVNTQVIEVKDYRGNFKQ